MANQKTVDIINIKRSKPGKVFKQTIMESIWLKKEAKLKDDGWLLQDDIKEIKTETVEDGKGSETVTIEEEIVEETETIEESKEYSEMDKTELQSACDSKEIKYHHATKKADLIALLEV